MEKTRYLFKFYYIGSNKFHGSQRQPGFLTIEDCILNGLIERGYIYDIKDSGFEVASRTDKFVSAKGAAFSVILEKRPYLMEINTALPKEIGVWAYTKVPSDFLSRFNAVYRHYKYLYFIENLNSYNIESMVRACNILVGHHNFINFSKREKEDVKTYRDIILASLKVEGDLLIFDFKSRAFLRQQIRRMVAKILEIGKGVMKFEDFLALFDEDTYISYQPAEPLGLILWDVKFPEDIQFSIDQKSIERMEAHFSSMEQKYTLKRELFSILQHNNISE